MPVYDTTNIDDAYYLISQTPPNFVEDNSYLSTLQDKINYDWQFRPNRKIIEEEKEEGSCIYTPIEVVIQSVKSDVGKEISDDWYKVVFKDCRRENRIGHRYRFSYKFDPHEDDDEKNIWIGVNQKTLEPTSSQVICRCNGSIASLYKDENGNEILHYEPVVQPSELQNDVFRYSEVAVDPQGGMQLLAQYNKFTKQYYINQRFVIGDNYVYKVTNIVRSNSRKTFKQDDVGIIRIYLQMDQSGDLDDFETRLAYNGGPYNKDNEVIDDQNYSLVIEDPNVIPDVIPESGFTFTPELKLNGVDIAEYQLTCELSLIGNGSELAQVEDYCKLIQEDQYTYTLVRLKNSLQMSANIVCTAEKDGHTITLPIVISLRPF